MIGIFKLLLICSLVKLLINTDEKLTCAIIYTIGLLILQVVFAALVGTEFTTQLIITIAIGTVIRFIGSYIYFWLLSRFDSGILFWIICILGIPLLMI
jgi:hypothetical protein